MTLGAVHSSEGRDLMVAYKSINGIDTVYLTYVLTPTVVYSQRVRRATISGTTITYHTTDTLLSQVNIVLPLSTPAFSSGGIEFDSSNKVHVLNGALDPNQDISWTGNATDPGTAEQATPPTWGTVTVVDNSQSNTVKSGYTCDVGGGNLLHIGDDGTADATLTALKSYSYPPGGSWSGNGSLTGTISAIDKNDWGAITRTTTDVHVVYRASTGSLVHKRWNGTAWGTGQTIPAQNNLAGGGIALTSDGVSVWLAVIDTDSANTVRYIQWTSGDYTGHGDAWEGAWSVVESASSTKTFLGCPKATDGNFTALFYWTEGTNFVAATASAPFPPDPPGLANRDAVSGLGTGAASATLAIPFTGTQPPKGDKIIVGFWASYGSAPTITSVKDNAAVQNTFTAAGASNVGGAQGVWIYWLDMPPGSSWSGNYTVTVTFSAAVTQSAGGAIAYSNMQVGGPSAVNNNTGSGASATSGAANPGVGFATYFAAVTDATGANPATFTWAVPFLKEVTQTNGATSQAGSVGDALNNTGSQNAAITIDNALWNAAIAVFFGAPVTFSVDNVRPGAAWLWQFQKGVRHPIQPASPAPAGPAVSVLPIFPARALRVSSVIVASSRSFVVTQTPTFTAISAVREERLLPGPVRAKSRTLGPARAPSGIAAVVPTRQERLLPAAIRAESRTLVPALQTPTFVAVVPVRKQLLLAPPSKAKGRASLAQAALATVAATSPARQRRRLSDASRAKGRARIALAPVVVTVAAIRAARALGRVVALRARSGARTAPQTPTVAATRVARALARGPALRGRGQGLRAPAAAQAPSARSTKPMKAPRQPRPTMADSRSLRVKAPPTPGVLARTNRDRPKVLAIRARPRVVTYRPPTPGVPARAFRNRVRLVVLKARPKTVVAPVQPQPGVLPTWARETIT